MQCPSCTDFHDGFCGQDGAMVGDKDTCPLHSSRRPPRLRLYVAGLDELPCVRCARWCKRRQQCRLPLGILARKDFTCDKAKR